MKPVQLGKNSIRFRKKKRMKFRRRNIPAARATVGRSPVIEIPLRNLDVENVQHNNRKKNTKHIHKSMNIKRRKKRVRIRFLKMTPVNETSKRVKDHGKKRVFFSLNHKKKHGMRPFPCSRGVTSPLMENPVKPAPIGVGDHSKMPREKKTLGNQRKVGSVGWASIKKKKTR